MVFELYEKRGTVSDVSGCELYKELFGVNSSKSMSDVSDETMGVSTKQGLIEHVRQSIGIASPTRAKKKKKTCIKMRRIQSPLPLPRKMEQRLCPVCHCKQIKTQNSMVRRCLCAVADRRPKPPDVDEHRRRLLQERMNMEGIYELPVCSSIEEKKEMAKKMIDFTKMIESERMKVVPHYNFGHQDVGFQNQYWYDFDPNTDGRENEKTPRESDLSSYQIDRQYVLQKRRKSRISRKRKTRSKKKRKRNTRKTRRKTRSRKS